MNVRGVRILTLSFLAGIVIIVCAVILRINLLFGVGILVIGGWMISLSWFWNRYESVASQFAENQHRLSELLNWGFPWTLLPTRAAREDRGVNIVASAFAGIFLTVVGLTVIWFSVSK